MKTKKDTIIQIRISAEQKEQIQQEAKELGMSVSAYILYLCEHKQIVVIQKGKELAEQVYRLNQILGMYEGNPMIPVLEIRDTVSQSILHIAQAMEDE